MSHAHKKLLVEAAKLYYVRQLTQAEIGRQLKTSRSTVSRLLQEARDTEIVKITIDYPWERNETLEKALKKRFKLKDVRVLATYEQPVEEMREGRGLLAAEYIDQIAKDGMTLAISYGRSIASTIKQLKPNHKVDLTVVQLIGALGAGNPLEDGPDLVRDTAEAFGGQYRYLHAPLLVEDSRTRDLLIQEPAVQESLALGRKADIAVLGIGALDSNSSGLIWTGYLTDKDIAWLRNKGSVGHMCAQHFDINGQLLDIDLNRRAIGIGLENLRGIKTVVAIAGSKEKAHAILGALHGNYLDVLITDDEAAKTILALEDASQK